MRTISSGNLYQPKIVQSGAYYIYNKCDNEILDGLERYVSNYLYHADYPSESEKFQ